MYLIKKKLFRRFRFVCCFDSHQSNLFAAYIFFLLVALSYQTSWLCLSVAHEMGMYSAIILVWLVGWTSAAIISIDCATSPTATTWEGQLCKGEKKVTKSTFSNCISLPPHTPPTHLLSTCHPYDSFICIFLNCHVERERERERREARVTGKIQCAQKKKRCRHTLTTHVFHHIFLPQAWFQAKLLDALRSTHVRGPSILTMLPEMS